jgi:hypothetical protein
MNLTSFLSPLLITFIFLVFILSFRPAVMLEKRNNEDEIEKLDNKKVFGSTIIVFLVCFALWKYNNSKGEFTKKMKLYTIDGVKSVEK